MKYLKTIGFNSNQPIGRGFNYPYDVAFSEDNRIFVLNRMGGHNSSGIRIQICTYDEDWLGEFATGPGKGDSQFVIPVCMSFNSKDLLYVTDESLNDIKVFDNQGNYITKWTTNSTGSQKFAGPSGIVHGSDDSVYLVEQYANKISKFTEDGQFLFSWGTEGNGEGEFNLPWGISRDVEGHLFIADWGNDRIQKFTADGEFIAAYGESGYQAGQFNKPSSVAIDSKGFIHVADWGNERVQVLDPDGEFHQLLEGEATLSKWAEEWLEVNLDEYDLRKESNLLVKEIQNLLHTPYHRVSQLEPIFWGPVSVKIDSEDRLYVTEHSRHRIQIYEQ